MENIILYFDGCHKLYYVHASDTATIHSMSDRGWEPSDMFPLDALKTFWEASCPLRLVSPASLDEDMPSIPQFEEDVDIPAFIEQVRSYYQSQGLI